MEQSSSFVQYQPFQLHLLHQEFQLDKLLHNGEEDTRSKRRRKGCVQVATSSDESIFFYCDKFFPPHRVRLHLKVGDDDSFGETRQQDEFKLIRRRVVLGWTSTHRAAWCPQVAKNLEKPPGLAPPLTWTLEETLGACSVVRDRVQIGTRSQELSWPCTGQERRHHQRSHGMLALLHLHFARLCRTSQVPWHANWSPPEWKLGKKLEKTVVVLHPSDFLPFFPESDNRLDVATGSTLPMETSWPVNRQSRRLPVVGASQKTRTMESHENFSTMREALPLKTKSGIPARRSPTASPALRRTACGCVARRPAHGSPGTWWPARMWTGDELTELSDFRSLARECQNGRLRAALVAPHVSQEPMVLKTLERFRLLRVLCLWSVAGLFSLNEILRR